MKLKFKNQDFQTQAVNAVADLFTGQEKTRSTFSVIEEKQLTLMNDLGIGNALYIDEKTITHNMHIDQPSFPRFPCEFLCKWRVTVPPKRANRLPSW